MFHFRYIPVGMSHLPGASGPLADAFSSLATSQPIDPAINSDFIPHQGKVVRFDVPIVDNAGETSVRAVWPQTGFDLSIYPPNLLERLGVWAGLQDIEVGHAEFDAQFRILGSDATMIKRVCTPLVIAMVRRLADLDGRGYVAWQIGQQEFRVSRPGRIADKTLQQRFLRWSLELYDHVLDFVVSDAAGLSTPQFSAQAARCGVCVELCDEDVVLCRKCGAPHHLECWTYNGCCSVFACRETQYNVPRRK